MANEAAAGDRRALLERLGALHRAIGRAVLGKDDVIDLVLTCLLARGHVLIEDIPGIGKTTLAHALACSLDCSFRRVQFTSDLLPSDILGVKVFDPAENEFRFMPGPIFNCVVLADEINRTTPRTQSALLEAMSESQVTIEGETYALPDPFFVIATQNPIEHYGTYPLPDSQLDRFSMSIPMGYPGREDERRILNGGRLDPHSEEFAPAMKRSEILACQRMVESIKMDDSIVGYLLELVSRTRASQGLRLGVSPRGSLALSRTAKARALLAGRDYCLPEDVKSLAVPVLAHRLILNGRATAEERRMMAVEILTGILDEVPVPL